jgi:hypothetical protein
MGSTKTFRDAWPGLERCRPSPVVGARPGACRGVDAFVKCKLVRSGCERAVDWVCEGLGEGIRRSSETRNLETNTRDYFFLPPPSPGPFPTAAPPSGLHLHPCPSSPSLWVRSVRSTRPRRTRGMLSRYSISIYNDPCALADAPVGRLKWRVGSVAQTPTCRS